MTNNNTTKGTTMAKLNENDIRNIILDHFGYGVKAKQISENYGISESYARRIIARKAWKNVRVTQEWLDGIRN